MRNSLNSTRWFSFRFETAVVLTSRGRVTPDFDLSLVEVDEPTFTGDTVRGETSTRPRESSILGAIFSIKSNEIVVLFFQGIPSPRKGRKWNESGAPGRIVERNYCFCDSKLLPRFSAIASCLAGDDDDDEGDDCCSENIASSQLFFSFLLDWLFCSNRFLFPSRRA